MSDTKERILLTALHLFARQGYEAVSTSMIASELGMTKGALYKHYKSKRDIFDSIVERMYRTDSESSQEHSVPDMKYEDDPEAYKSISISSIREFTISQFIFWTENGFASDFRRMLTLEQYRNAEMSELYGSCLAEGPVAYMADIFREMMEHGRLKGSDPMQLAAEYYAPFFLLVSISDRTEDKDRSFHILNRHMEEFFNKYSTKEKKMKYIRSEKYNTPELQSKIMGPNPVKLEEELLLDHNIPQGSIVCDLGSGQGLTSVFLAKEYGFTVYAADLWSDPDENRKFFDSMGLSSEQIIPVKADASALPFDKEFFDAVVCVDSYNYFGRDASYLDEKLLPFVKSGGYIYISVPGMKKDLHNNLPQELLLSWNEEQLDYIHDIRYWTDIVSKCVGAEIISIKEMESNEEVWADWLKQDNEYAVGDRKTMEAGGGKYLNFISIILKKK